MKLSQPPRPPKGTRFGGRSKGTPNKIGAGVREAIQRAFEAVGGADYLVKLANEDPKTFVPLLAKLIPSEVKAEISGNDGDPIEIRQITRIIVDPVKRSET